MLLALLVVCVLLVVVLPLLGTAISILWAVVLGLVLGLVARTIAPGRTRGLGVLWTTVCGVAGGLGGGLVAELLDTGLIGRLLLQVLAAVLLVMALRPSPAPKTLKEKSV